jgi:hypothetical protein
LNLAEIDRAGEKPRMGKIIDWRLFVKRKFLLVNLYSEGSPAWEDAKQHSDIIDLAATRTFNSAIFLYGDNASEYAISFRRAYAGFLNERDVPWHVFPRPSSIANIETL